MRLSRQKWGWALLGLFCLSIAANLAVTPSSVQGASASAASAQVVPAEMALCINACHIFHGFRVYTALHHYTWL